MDGEPCTPFTKNSFQIAPAQQIDLSIYIKNKNLILFETTSDKLLPTVKFLVKGNTRLNQGTNKFKLLKLRNNYPDVTNTEIIDIHMQGGAMGNLSSAIYKGKKKHFRELASNDSKLWAFNKKIGDYSNIIGDIKIGKTVILKVWNDTSWKHSMHLHGHHFWVNSFEFGNKSKLVMRDTYLMQPQEKVDLVFIADNEGLWLFHCHMLEHAASGMIGVINIS